MIIVRLMGGLGNQLFQYAAGYAIARKENHQLLIDNRFYGFYKLHGGYRLDNFNISAEIMGKKDEKYFPEWQARIINRFPIFEKLSAKWCHESSYSNLKNMHNKYALLGYWQKEDFFREYSPEIKKEFSLKMISHETRNIGLRMAASNSVSVHIRRGDYLRNPEALRVHGLCGIEYYRAAISEVKSRVECPHFYVFSDDMTWCQKNLNSIFNGSYVEWTSSQTQEEDLWLMSQARNHIIANSTFSWWGAWLGASEQQIVICPDPWYDKQPKYGRDPTLGKWIRLRK